MSTSTSKPAGTSSLAQPPEILRPLGSGSLEEGRVNVVIGKKQLATIPVQDLPEFLRVLARQVPVGASFMNYMLKAADEAEAKNR
jgi:hypothetical protein